MQSVLQKFCLLFLNNHSNVKEPAKQQSDRMQLGSGKEGMDARAHLPILS